MGFHADDERLYASSGREDVHRDRRCAGFDASFITLGEAKDGGIEFCPSCMGTSTSQINLTDGEVKSVLSAITLGRGRLRRTRLQYERIGMGGAYQTYLVELDSAEAKLREELRLRSRESHPSG